MPQEGLINRFILCLEELKQLNIGRVVETIAKANHVFTAGNGGSAATASHFASDLNRIGVKATCLSDNTVAITSFANDISYDDIFSAQCEMIKNDDILIVLSVSAKSTNLIKAIQAANARGAVTIALAGSGGGMLAELAKQSLVLNSDKYGEIEGLHSCLCHIIPILIQERRDEWD